MNIAFIGLGHMGSAMAGNLIKTGHTLTVFNRTRSKAEALAALGASIADSPAQATQGCEVMITMLADDAALESVVFAPGNPLDTLARGAVHVSMSTISVALSRRLDESHRARGQHYLAAPVFGRPEAAAAAKLFIVAGGPVEVVRRCQPLFDAMGQRTYPVSADPAAASVIKLAGNFILSTVIESLAESFALGKKYGVDPNVFLELLTTSLFPVPVYKNYGAMIAADKYEPVGFALPLGLKDNNLVLAAAAAAKVPMPLATLLHQRFDAALAMGLKDLDWASIARVSYREAGV